jgi:N12 class adenine-specific DNA methylase
VGLAWANEVRRLGLARRVLITVPNNLVEQWGAEANQLYPDMRVLVMSPEDFTKERRGEFLSRIATEDFDAVICAHTSFGFIPTMRATRDFIHAEVWKLRSYLEELRAKANKDDKKSLKDIEKKILNLETKLKEIETSSKKDDGRVISWEELGIDALFVDEAQEFKNLYVPTTMGSIPGVPKGDSKRAFDMRVKTRDSLRRGGRVVFATGTPVMNSVGECFVFKVYLAEELLEEHGLEMFDAWARTFAEVVPVFEMTPDGGGFRVNSRLARFVNLPELFNMWYRFTFSRSREQMGLPVPALMGGKRLAISVPASPRLKAFVRDCVRRVDDIKTGKVDPREDNMLKVVSDGAKAALDTRMIFGGEPDPVNKIGVLADYVAEIYRQYEEAKGAQIIYCELGTPKR